jgi:RHS repeat-associated core domain
MRFQEDQTQARRLTQRAALLPQSARCFGVGASSGQKGAITPSAGQRVLTKYTGPRGEAGWVQQGSSSGRLGDSKPAAHWGMAAVAIAAHAGQAPGGSAARVATAPQTGGPVSPSTALAADIGPHRKLGTASTGGARADGVGLSSVSRNYTYNKRGDRTGESVEGATLSLGYDQANRLVSVGNDISYAYNGDGLRMSKTVKGLTTSFAWSEAEGMPELLQSGATSYIYGPEEMPIEQISAGTPVFLHRDQQGSTRLLTDAAGNAVGRYEYGPWGSVIKHTGTATTDLQFDGQHTDAETGYQYLRARYYDPKTGQFLTVDPASPETLSRYVYANNDPEQFADPLGLWGVHICLGGCISYKSGNGWGTGIGLGGGVQAGWLDFSGGANLLGYPSTGQISISGAVGLLSGEADTGDGKTTVQVCVGLKRIKHLSICPPLDSGGSNSPRNEPNPMPMFEKAHEQYMDKYFNQSGSCPR